MILWIRLQIICAAWFMLAGELLAADPVLDRGFVHTTFDREIASGAVGRSNRLLEGSGIQFDTSGSNRSDNPSGRKSVPVYLVKSKRNGSSMLAAVPSGCRCVFVNTHQLAEWVAFNSRGSGRLTLDRGHILTFLLLHEAGHIAKGTPGAAVENGIASQLNIDPSRAKAAEEEADDFAIGLLRSFGRATPASIVSLDANWTITELTKLSWNMQAFRTLEEFGAFAVGKRSVYFDNGYSHPNLAWRILRANYHIQQTVETQKLLEAFEDARRRGAISVPLFEHKAQ